MGLFKKIAGLAGISKKNYIYDIRPFDEKKQDSIAKTGDNYYISSGKYGFSEREKYDGGKRFDIEKSGKYIYENLNNINMCYPRRFEDIIRLIDSVRSGEAVIVELEFLPGEICQKMLDFMSGAIYALGGGMQRISGTTFLFTPKFVRVTNNDYKGNTN